MLKIAICDSEKCIASQIEKNLYSICQKEGICIDINVFYNGFTLERQILQREMYDLLYIGIKAENDAGITTVSNIRKMDENIIIIFVSECNECKMELFCMDIFAYVKKPIEPVVFWKTFREAHRKICSKNYYFSFRYRNEEFKIPCKDILYFESNGRKISVHIHNGDIEVFNGKLADVQEKLETGKISFLRIHQSFLVNYHMIKARTKTEVTLITNIRLPISEERQKKFSREYGYLLGSEKEV